MSQASLGTTMMRLWVGRMQNGDLAAREELLRTVCGRMELFARRMMKDYPSVGRWAETDDVLQNALMRLLRALQEIQPSSMREFFRLGALQIRRELLDLTRHIKGAEGPQRNQVALDSGIDPASGRGENDLDRWHAFHEAVDTLPTDEREVVGLMFYHGWTHAEVAELLQVTERSVRRWWQSARLKLHQQLRCLESME